MAPVDRSRPAEVESDDFEQPAAANPGKRFQSRRPAAQQFAVEDLSDDRPAATNAGSRRPPPPQLSVEDQEEEAPATRAQQPPTRGGVPRQRLQV